MAEQHPHGPFAGITRRTFIAGAAATGAVAAVVLHGDAGPVGPTTRSERP